MAWQKGEKLGNELVLERVTLTLALEMLAWENTWNWGSEGLGNEGWA